MGHIGKLIEEMDYKLLSIKIIEASKSLKRKVVVWISQFAKGIGNILENAFNYINKLGKNTISLSMICFNI